jgi:FkbM family methyltransferase
VREFLKRSADAAGVTRPLRQILASRSARRARLDTERLRLLLAFCLRSDSNCIDVGSYHGSVLAEMLRLAPEGSHIAYEPLPHLSRELANRFRTVTVRCAALSNVDGKSSFVYVKNSPSSSGMRRTTYQQAPDIESIIVRTERLDDHLPDGYAPTLIKIDVEGAERLVIEGAIRTLTTHRPIVVFEHGKGGAEYYDTKPADIFGLLCGEARLRLFDLDGNGPYSLGRFEATFESNERWNFVAHP